MDTTELLKLTAEEIHKPRRIKFPTRSVTALYTNQIWAVDIADMTGSDNQDKADNKGYRYILVIVDVYSRYASVAALKTKTAAEVIDAFINICENIDGKPSKIWADQGGEFVNDKMNIF